MRTVEALEQGSASGSKEPANSVIYWWQVSAGKAPAPSLKVPLKVLPTLLFPGSHSQLREWNVSLSSSPDVPVVLQS